MGTRTDKVSRLAVQKGPDLHYFPDALTDNRVVIAWDELH